MSAPRAGVLLGLTVGYAVVLALLVLTPISDQLGEVAKAVSRAWTTGLSLPGDLTPSRAEALLNVALFVPIGVLAGAFVPRYWWAAVLLCVAVSAAVELVQELPALHRFSSVRDVLANGAGGAVGVALERAAARIVVASDRRGRHRAGEPLR